jgi:hypothetical protein
MAAQSESIELAGIEDGKAPKTRLSDADKAALIVDQLIRANAKRSEVNARVKSSLDGNPPYDPGVLRRNSQSHRTNVNFREAEGISNAAVSLNHRGIARCNATTGRNLTASTSRKRLPSISTGC